MTNTDTTEPATPGETANTEAAPVTPADSNPAAETKPEFCFPGVPRRQWGKLCEVACEADKKAAEAEADADATEARHRECLARLSAATENLTAAERAATVAKGRAKVADDAVERVTSEAELDERTREADEAKKAAFEAEKTVASINAEIERLRFESERLRVESEREREHAARLREAAERARKFAEDNEVPRIRERMAEMDEAQRRRREADALRAARHNLARVNCRDCRFWEPGAYDPREGKCHARPPALNHAGAGSFVKVDAGYWCGTGEPIFPAPDTLAPDGDTPAPDGTADGDTAAGNDAH